MSDIERMTVADFVDRYYRPDRLRATAGRRERIIADREQDLRDHGSTLIARHESVTGDAVVLYDPGWAPKRYVQWLATTDGEEPYTDAPEPERTP